MFSATYAARAAHQYIAALATQGDGSNKVVNSLNKLGKVLTANYGGKIPTDCQTDNYYDSMALFARRVLDDNAAPAAEFTDEAIAAAIETDTLALGLAATGAPGLARDRAVRVLQTRRAVQAALSDA